MTGLYSTVCKCVCVCVLPVPGLPLETQTPETAQIVPEQMSASSAGNAESIHHTTSKRFFPD